MESVCVEVLGEVAYPWACQYQEQLVAQHTSLKLAKKHGFGTTSQAPPPHYLLFCSHPPVITGGKRANTAQELLSPPTALARKGIAYHPTSRGGALTYHGPGQLVVYPILDLERLYKDIHRYIRMLEDVIIDTLACYGIKACRLDKLTGVWVSVGEPPCWKKIAAIGVRCTRWVVMHGLALNITTQLSDFNHIIPCGIKDKGVISMEALLEKDHPLTLQEVGHRLLTLFVSRFGLTAYCAYPKVPSAKLRPSIDS